MSQHDEELDQPALDDEERAFRHAEQERDREQDEADNDAAPGPAPDDD